MVAASRHPDREQRRADDVQPPAPREKPPGEGTGALLRLQQGDPADHATSWNTSTRISWALARSRHSQGWDSDGHRTRAEVSHPFASLPFPQSHEFALDVFGQTTRTYADEDVNAAYHQDHRGVTLEAGFSRPWAGVRRPSPSALQQRGGRRGPVRSASREAGRPPSRPAHVPHRLSSATSSPRSNDLMKLNYVNRDLRVEDFNLGWGLSGRFGFAPKEFLGSAGKTAFVRLKAGRGTRLGEKGFVLASVSYETRLNGGPKNEIVSASLDVVEKLPTRHLQTVVANSGTTRAGTSTGTSSSSRTGSWACAATASFVRGRQTDDREPRTACLPRQGDAPSLLAGSGVLRRYRRGGSSGHASSPFEFQDGRGGGPQDVDQPRAHEQVYRIDFAYALDRDPFGRRGLLVSFSASQGF